LVIEPSIFHHSFFSRTTDDSSASEGHSLAKHFHVNTQHITKQELFFRSNRERPTQYIPAIKRLQQVAFMSWDQLQQHRLAQL